MTTDGLGLARCDRSQTQLDAPAPVPDEQVNGCVYTKLELEITAKKTSGAVTLAVTLAVTVAAVVIAIAVTVAVTVVIVIAIACYYNCNNCCNNNCNNRRARPQFSACLVF